MPGFEKREIPKNKIQIDDIDEEDFEVNVDIEDSPSTDSKIEKKNNAKVNTTNKKGNQRNGNPNQVKRPVNKDKKEDNMQKYIIAGIAVVIIVIIIVFLVINMVKKDEPVTVDEPAIVNQQSDDNVKAGVPSLNGTGAEQNDSIVSDPSLIVKDLNGNPVEPNYKVMNNEEVTDFISYTKYRSPMGNGVEFYWLEATYKGQPYKVQVPYSIYSKLDREGITVVDIELLTLEDNSKIVTYMKVRKDAKSLLDKNR